MLSRASIIDCIEKGLIHYDPLPDNLEECAEIDNTSILCSLGQNVWVTNDATGPLDDAGWQLIDASNSFPLLAHQSALVHTDEFIGSASPFLNCQMFPTSQATGHGLEIIPAHGDPGYISRWTLKIRNCFNHPITVPFGALLFQAVFSEVDYPNVDDLEENEPIPIISALYEGYRNKLHEQWTIHCMLPSELLIK